MTNQEAINVMEKYTDTSSSRVVSRAHTLAISALQKQIPRKPEKVADAEIRYTDSYRCPSCGGGFTGTGIADYCYHCGQRLEWEA